MRYTKQKQLTVSCTQFIQEFSYPFSNKISTHTKYFCRKFTKNRKEEKRAALLTLLECIHAVIHMEQYKLNCEFVPDTSL